MRTRHFSRIRFLRSGGSRKLARQQKAKFDPPLPSPGAIGEYAILFIDRSIYKPRIQKTISSDESSHTIRSPPLETLFPAKQVRVAIHIQAETNNVTEIYRSTEGQQERDFFLFCVGSTSRPVDSCKQFVQTYVVRCASLTRECSVGTGVL